MPDSQKCFTKEDGNAYYRRNYSLPEERGGLTRSLEQRLSTMCSRLPDVPKRILEMGCCFGRNLEFYRNRFDAECFGIDISEEAINTGKRLYPKLDLRVGDACALPYGDEAFDLVILGYFLCYLDPGKLFKIAAEVDRVLQSDGFIVLHDFDTPFPFRNSFKHNPGLYMHKLNFRSMFLWNPAYTLAEIQALSVEGNEFSKEVNNRVSYSIIYKSELNNPSFFLTDPFGEC